MEIQGLTLGAVILILLKELIGMFSNSRKENTEALKNATHAIIKLETKIEHINERLDDIPEMKKDINALHGKVREIKTKIDGSLS